MLRIYNLLLREYGRRPDYIFDQVVNSLPPEIDSVLIRTEKQIDEFAPKCDAFIIAIGNTHGSARLRIAHLLSHRYGLLPLTLLHPSSSICDTAFVGSGTVVLRRAVIGSYCKIGAHCIINTASSIDHECEIGDGVHIMGGAVITGRVNIANCASIGSNATILPDLNIGENSIVGAGAVVTKDVPPGTTVVGCPARPLKLDRPVI